jgi:hypothetical protein
MPSPVIRRLQPPPLEFAGYYIELPLLTLLYTTAATLATPGRYTLYPDDGKSGRALIM